MEMTVLRPPGDEDEEKVETERKNRKRWIQSNESQKVVPRASADFVRQLKILKNVFEFFHLDLSCSATT